MQKALKLFARLSKGHYPKVKMVYGDVTRDKMFKMADVSSRDFQNPLVLEIRESVWGLAEINSVLRDNSDAAYHGLTAGPHDGKKVLLRWLASDGKYNVIFADLSFEQLDKAKLEAIE